MENSSSRTSRFFFFGHLFFASDPSFFTSCLLEYQYICFCFLKFFLDKFGVWCLLFFRFQIERLPPKLPPLLKLRGCVLDRVSSLTFYQLLETSYNPTSVTNVITYLRNIWISDLMKTIFNLFNTTRSLSSNSHLQQYRLRDTGNSLEGSRRYQTLDSFWHGCIQNLCLGILGVCLFTTVRLYKGNRGSETHVGKCTSCNNILQNLIFAEKFLCSDYRTIPTQISNLNCF